jgi:hypothetical protein
MIEGMATYKKIKKQRKKEAKAVAHKQSNAKALLKWCV